LVDGEVRDVDSNPASPEAFGRLDGGAAAAERVEHKVPLVAARRDNALQESHRLLRRPTQALLGLGVDRRDVVPKRVDRLALQLVKKPLALNPPIGIVGNVKPSLRIHLFHSLA